MSDLRIFSGSSNVALAKEICAYLDIELSRLNINTFSNGNLSVQILQNVREKDVFVIQSFTEPVNRNIIELFITMDALRSASAVMRKAVSQLGQRVNSMVWKAVSDGYYRAKRPLGHRASPFFIGAPSRRHCGSVRPTRLPKSRSTSS